MCVVSQRAELGDVCVETLLKEDSATFIMEPSQLMLLAVSANLCRQIRRSSSDLEGQTMEMAFQHGLPAHAVSRSANSKIRAFCEACTERDLFRNGEVTCIQACQRGDGTRFVAYQLFHSCQVQGRCLVLCVQLELCEGDRPDMKMNLAQFHEEARVQLLQALKCLGSPVSLEPPILDEKDVGFRFYGVRLQEQSMLLDEGRSCQRREFDVLPRGAQVFGDRPIQPEAGGLRFAVRVEAASKAFCGLPFLGFTRQVPSDCPTLYPDVATNMAQSLLLGGDGGASARDQLSHFKSSFRAPPQHEVQTFSLQPDLPRNKRQAPAEPNVGDILEGRYTSAGLLQMFLNDQKLMDFDTGRPLNPDVAHYAVVDVAFAAYRLSLVPPTQPFPMERSCSSGKSPESTCCDDEESIDLDPSNSCAWSMTTMTTITTMTTKPSMELDGSPTGSNGRLLQLACVFAVVAAGLALRPAWRR